ncbi:partitioning defective 3 homolog isoform X2 [Apostichopus japonicus]|uniref:partitioning defective 3 homolog isoform X2 n=1 Tax=Stichopus japonicus TaxID=307972 RepID=UPI003AB5BE4A
MKVTVCFGPVKIIVPCGDGALTVQDLIEKSIQRYRKALGKDDLYWVKVHSLQSQSDGGILDGDDLVNDVADDREKLTAHFEEEETGVAKELVISDGPSSIGTPSPINMNEMNHINNSNNKIYSNGTYPQENGDLDIVITGREAESKLKVRHNGALANRSNTQPLATSTLDSNANTLPFKNANKHDSDEELAAFDRFSRDSSRRSLSSAHPSVFKWAEAQQRLEDMVNQDPTSPTASNPLAVTPPAKEQFEIKMVNDGTPLGIHIVARVENEDGSGYGLVVHGIESGGRAARDKRLQLGDHILAINNTNITQETFDSAQDMMRDAMRAPSVKLLLEREKVPSSPSKVPPSVPQRSPQTTLTRSKKDLVGGQTSTKRLGRKLYIQLMKGPQSLGFSVTTRDNPIAGKHPIYIKNILPNGAAIADGRLKPGDWLLEVNGIEMTGKSQDEAVSILRSVRRGGVVNLVVSRQEPVEADEAFPRVLPADLSPDDYSNPNNKTVLDFDIALNDTGSAGLGVSVKGKTTGGGNAGEAKDLGIFIKSVMHGGAASKDGRLRPNDQLLYINNVSLINMSNSQAMDTLRKAMSSEKSPRSTIRLVIARRQDVPGHLHNAHNKVEAGVEASPDRGIDISREVDRPIRSVDRPQEKDEEAEEVLRQPLMSDQGSLLQNISETLSAKHNLSLSPKLGSSSGSQTEGRARVTYPYATVGIHPAGGMTLPSSGEEGAVIENGGLQVHVGVHSPNGTNSISPRSPQAPSSPEWLSNWKTEDGELSPVLTRDQFQRDSYARLSFSERKQGGSLDAKQMAWYKKNKDTNDTDDIAPAPMKRVDQTENLKKSSSMDRLNERERRSATEKRPSRSRLSRKNGLNESFRAAVDRSLPGKEPEKKEDKPEEGSQLTRDRKRATKEKKKKEKDVGGTGTNSKGIKGFFRFGKNRKSVSEDKDSEISKDDIQVVRPEEEEDKQRGREDARDEQDRIQDSLQRQRDESQEARNKAERMLELRMKYQQNHRDYPPEKYQRDEDDDQLSDRDEKRIPQEHSDRFQSRERDRPDTEDRDKRYERLSEGRSHPEREYRDSRGRYYDDHYDRRNYDNFESSNYDNPERGHYDNYNGRTREYDRRTHEYDQSDHRERRHSDRRYYQTERPRRSDNYSRDGPSERQQLNSKDAQLETKSTQGAGAEKKSRKDSKSESPTEEKETKNSIFRRGSGKGSKKEKKKQKESRERSDSERDEDKRKKGDEDKRKKGESEQHLKEPTSPGRRDAPPSEVTVGREGHSRGQREDHRRQSRDRPDDKGYGRRNRSHERPTERERRDNWNRDRRPEDWDRREDDRRRTSRPYGGTERGPRLHSSDQRDFGSLDRHSKRDSRGDHQRPYRDENPNHHDGRYAREHHPVDKQYSNGDPRYPKEYHQGLSGHQRSKSYDVQEFTNHHYDRGDGYEDPPLSPRTGYSRGYYERGGGYHSQDDAARV